MTSSEHHLTVSRTARVLTAGATASERRTVLLALHGYAQRAEEMVEMLGPLLALDPTLGVIAPEALSRFYRRGATGEEIGASWMTRLDRLHEISDYLAYLDTVKREMIGETERLIVLGFSQGAATAGRWGMQHAGSIAHLVLWGGALPPEIAENDLSLSQLPHTTLVHGERDPLARQSTLETQVEQLKRNGVNAELLLHKGAHEITAEALAALAARIGHED